MISLQKEERILTLLDTGRGSVRQIALSTGVSRSTVSAIRDNRVSRAAIRAVFARRKFTATGERTIFHKIAQKCLICKTRVTTLPCVFCNVGSVDSEKYAACNYELKLDRLLGKEGKRFVCVAEGILDLDSMRVIHHPLFASLVKQARDALKLLPKESKP